MAGKRIIGRPRLGLLDEVMSKSYVDMKRGAED